MAMRKKHITYIDIRKLFVGIIVAIILVAATIKYWDWTKVTRIEFSSKEMSASWQVYDSAVIKKITQGIGEKIPGKVSPPAKDIITIRLVSKRETKQYLFYGSYIFDPLTQQGYRVTDDFITVLHQVATELHHRCPFGDLLDWDHITKLFQIGVPAQVKDLDTGRTFQVRRLGGYGHAEVEPLTSRDSNTIRMLYNGEWSWKRRAVIVETAGLKAAASLVGMPKGTGQLLDNGCNGTVGLYFPGKSVRRHVDLSHYVMIWKAAGKTVEQLREATPEEAILVLFTALDQRDAKTATALLDGPKLNHTQLAEVIGVTTVGIKKQAPLVYQVRASVTLRRGPYNHIRTVQLRLVKDQQSGIFKASPDFLISLLKSL